MTDPFIFPGHDPGSSQVSCTGGVVTIGRRCSLGEVLFLIPWALACLVLFAVTMVLAVLMLRDLVTHFDFVLLLMGVVFALGSCVLLWGLSVMQSLIFPFRVVLDGTQYRLANGAKRIVRAVPVEKREIVVYPVYRRGDWAIQARIGFNAGWKWPLIPNETFGTKYEALQQALRLQDWLHRNCGQVRVVLDARWGDTSKIRPRTDYVR